MCIDSIICSKSANQQISKISKLLTLGKFDCDELCLRLFVGLLIRSYLISQLVTWISWRPHLFYPVFFEFHWFHDFCQIFLRKIIFHSPFPFIFYFVSFYRIFFWKRWKMRKSLHKEGNLHKVIFPLISHAMLLWFSISHINYREILF